jgi:hypothetical protein
VLRPARAADGAGARLDLPDLVDAVKAKLPLAVRLMNRVPVDRAIRLAPEALLSAAQRRTGLTDFGAPFFRRGLERLVESLEREASLTPLGRVIARRDALRLLENRLLIHDVLRKNPEIERAPIERPLFVVGLPRTGTTILHELLAQDPESRVPMTWEVMHPFPPPERASFETDPRIAEVERHFSGIDRLLPDFKRMHPMGARLPQECVALTALEFATMIHHTTHRVPSYQAWLEGIDHRPVYASHRRQLQYLQWRCPAPRWVLKSPGHLWSLEALLAVYPDARFVFTHRDPLRVVASLVSLIATLRSLASDRIDPHEIGADWTARLAAGLEGAMRARERAGLGPERVLDVQFRELIGNEIGTVRSIYANFGLALSAEAEARMRRFLAENPRDKHGAHRYGIGFAGLDAAAERRRYAAYQERYAIPSEPEE